MNSKKFQKLINVSAPVLITGDTGTGKSAIAKKIFEQARIHREKFLTVHLASLKEDLIESELFGYKKGAFTGALDCKNGYLKDVGSGTLFLDEIGELSIEAQKKLLYLLEEKKFTPLGSTQSQDFRGRIIMATNKNLAEMVKSGTFREDLYYRILVFKLELPKISDDKVTLQKSIEEVLMELKFKYHKLHLNLSPHSFSYLMNLEWKGNFRELRNTLEYAVAMSDGPVIQVEDFPTQSFQINAEAKKENFIDQFPEDFGDSVELFEKLFLAAIFEKYSGKVNETARRLGMSKTTLIYKAKKYQINTLRMRADASDLAA